MSGADKVEAVGDRREQIFCAALTCFARGGYHQTTMDDIVTESGLSKGTLYWYFRGKKALFLALFEHLMGQLAERWQDIVDREEGAVAKLRASLEFFQRDVEPLASAFRVMIEAWALTREDSSLAARVQEASARFRRILQRILQQGVEEGVFRVESAEDTSFVLMTLASGMVVRMATRAWEPDWPAIMSSVSSLVFEGLRVRENG